MPINLNQFSQTAIQGMADLQYKGSVISAVLDSTQSASVVAGQAVKQVSTSSGVPKVVAVTSNNDTILGFALYSVENGYYSNTLPGSRALEVALKESVVYMTANAAIAAGQTVQLDNAAVKVGPRTTGKSIGWAIDAAAADGDLIRVYIDVSPSTGATGTVQTQTFTATLAEINAGKVLIPGVAGKQITLLNFIDRVTGAFATGTSVDLQAETAGTKAVVHAEAGLTNGAVLVPGSANVTLGAGYGVPLTAGEGLKVVNVGSAQTGGTSISFTLTYTQA